MMKSLKLNLKSHFPLSPPPPPPPLPTSSPFLSKPYPTTTYSRCALLAFQPMKTLSLSNSPNISWRLAAPHASSSSSSSSLMASIDADSFSSEEAVEKAIYRSRFMTLLGVFGSLIGSVLCFIQGCTIVAASFVEHFARSGKVMVLLIEALDVYLLGTVMLIFGMGLYELFVCNLDIAESLSEHNYRSSLFGLFTLVERPKWLEIKSVNELKTKVGHVIVLLLLIGLFDKAKRAAIHSPLDLLCFSASVLLCSGCLYLLSKLNGSK